MKILIGSYTQTLSEEIVGQGDGISIYELDEVTRELTCLSSYQLRNPAYLALDRDRGIVYVAEELNTDDAPMLFSLSIGADSTLRPLDQKLIKGSLACHITYHAGKLFISNYGSGDVIIQSVVDDRFSASRSLIEHIGSSVNEQRQASAHAHMTSFLNDDRFYVPDLGMDRCVGYRMTADGVEADSDNDFILPDGEGPRHMVFSDDNLFAYVIGELTGKVSVFEVETKELVQQIPSLPKYYDGVPSAAAVRLHPNGRYLYVSNRGINLLTSFEMLEDGLLRLLTYTYLIDHTPREFNISPDGRFLIVAGQDSHTLSFYSLGENGEIEFIKTFNNVKSPSCIQFLD